MKRGKGASQSRCPSQSELADFTTGRLTTVASDAIAEHIGWCDSCQVILQEVDQDGDPMIAQLRDSFLNPPADEGEFGRVAAQVESIHAVWCQAAAQSSSDALRPSALSADSELQIRCPYCHELSPAEDMTGDDSVLCSQCGGKYGLALSPSGAEDMGPGTRIAHFELQESLGEGSFGTVWKAYDTVLKRAVALKLPRKERLCGRNVENLLREARVAAQVRHPGIVNVYEIGIENDTIFLANELVEGDSLEVVLSRQGYSVREAAELCLTIAKALGAAHAAGTVHRDLKPANILLDRGGNPRIADFGLATHSAIDVVVSAEGRILGTPVYMSPEQASGKVGDVNERSDIYSLGVILYRLLTGRLPFGGDIHILVSQILLEDPIRPRALNARLPRDLETICLKCLEKKASRRYETAEELAVDLRLFLDGKPIHARPITRIGRAWRWARRKPALATVSVLALVLLASTIAALEFGRWNAMSALDDAQRHLYFLGISSVQQRWLSNDVSVAEATLNECPEQFRDFEWNYLRHLLSTPTRQLPNAGGAIAYCPDGHELATGGGGELALKIWDVQTGRRVHRLTGHASALEDLDYSPDGTMIVSAGGRDRTVRLWEAIDGDLIRTLGQHGALARKCWFSADGSKVISYGNDQCVRVWETATGESLQTISLDVNPVRDVAYSPLTHQLAVASRRSDLSEVTIYDCDSEELILRIPVFKTTVGSLAYSVDGGRLAVGEVRGAIRVWQLEPLSLLATIAGPVGEKCRVVFDAAGERVAAQALDGTVRVWEIERGQTEFTFRGHVTPVQCLAFSPDGTQLAAGAGSSNVCIWDVTTEQGSIAYTGGSTSVVDVAFSPNAQLLAAAFGSGAIRIWERSTGQLQRVLDDSGDTVYSVSFSPDGRQLVAASDDSTARIFDVKTGALLFHFKDHKRPLRCAIFSLDGSRVASSGLDRTVRLWDPWTGEVERTFRLKGPSIRSLAFHKNGCWLAGGGAGGTVAVWDIVSGEQLWTASSKWPLRVWEVAFSPCGEYLAVSRGDGTVKLHGASDGVLVKSFGNLAHGAPVGLAFSPHGRRIVTATAQCPVAVGITIWSRCGQPVTLPNHHRHRGLRSRRTSDRDRRCGRHRAAVASSSN